VQCAAQPLLPLSPHPPMNDLLSNPAVQAGVAPFVAALLAAFALARTRLHATAPLLALSLLLALTIGFALEPFTAVKKLLLLTLGAGLISWALEATGQPARPIWRYGLPVVAALGSVWMLQRVLAQKTPGEAWMLAGTAALFVFAVVALALWTSDDATVATASGLGLGWGSGALAVLGASALLGQIGIALGTACAALLLVQMLRGQTTPGWTQALMPGVGAALVGVLACATGELHALYLLPLLLVPLAPRLLPRGQRGLRLHTCIVGFAAVLPAALAVGWTLFAVAAGQPG